MKTTMSITIHIDHTLFSVLCLHLLYDGILRSRSKHGGGEHMISLSVSKEHLKVIMCVVALRHLLKTVSLSLFSKLRRAYYASLCSKQSTMHSCTVLLFPQN